jgi:hypothetical protein
MSERSDRIIPIQQLSYMCFLETKLKVVVLLSRVKRDNKETLGEMSTPNNCSIGADGESG